MWLLLYTSIGQHWSKKIYYWSTVTNLVTFVFSFLLSYYKVSGQQTWPWMYRSISKEGTRNHSRYFKMKEIQYRELGYQIVIKIERAKGEGGGVAGNSELQKAAPTPIGAYACTVTQQLHEPVAVCWLHPGRSLLTCSCWWWCWNYWHYCRSQQSASTITELESLTYWGRTCQKHYAFYLFTLSNFCKCFQLANLSRIQLAKESENVVCKLLVLGWEGEDSRMSHSDLL